MRVGGVLMCLGLGALGVAAMWGTSGPSEELSRNILNAYVTIVMQEQPLAAVARAS